MTNRLTDPNNPGNLNTSLGKIIKAIESKPGCGKSSSGSCVSFQAQEVFGQPTIAEVKDKVLEAMKSIDKNAKACEMRSKAVPMAACTYYIHPSSPMIKKTHIQASFSVFGENFDPNKLTTVLEKQMAKAAKKSKAKKLSSEPESASNERPASSIYSYATGDERAGKSQAADRPSSGGSSYSLPKHSNGDLAAVSDSGYSSNNPNPNSESDTLDFGFPKPPTGVPQRPSAKISKREEASFLYSNPDKDLVQWNYASDFLAGGRKYSKSKPWRAVFTTLTQKNQFEEAKATVVNSMKSSIPLLTKRNFECKEVQGPEK